MSDRNIKLNISKEDLKIMFSDKRAYFASLFAIYEDLYVKTGAPGLIEGMNYCLQAINENWRFGE